MSMTDPIAAALSKILMYQKLGAKIKVSSPNVVRVPYSNIVRGILNVLEIEGYIGKVEIIEAEDNSPARFLDIPLLYRRGKPVINRLERVSKPGKRCYAKTKAIPRVDDGLGIMILSTSKGIMSDKQARALNCGGELLCKVGA